ncbi:MAG: ATP-binding protein [Microthrixaceae bacterium]
MLVGRDLLLEAGDVAIHAALAGRGRLLLLSGEAGIGKTSLAVALADRAAGLGALVRTGACWESERLPPFTPWLDVLHRPGNDACASAATHLEGSDGQDTRDASDALRARGRRFAGVVDALRTSGLDRPQVVVLEDLHWADSESLDLLVAVTAHLPTMPVLVIGTYRDDEVDPSSRLASVGGNADRLALTGLEADSVALVLAAVLGRTPTVGELDAVQRQTGGNPLFITQVARLLDAGSSALPSGVRDVLLRRFARTSESCNRLLGAAAVLGAEFDGTVLSQIVGSPIDEALDEAVAARLVVPVDDVPGRWRFVHALVQATRYEALSSRERASLHRAAVDALRGRPGVSPATLAHHAARGDFDPEDLLPATILTAAGHEALDRLAWPDALAAFERVLAVAPLGPAGDEARAEAWLGIGATRLRRGDKDTRTAFDEAAAVARRTGRADLLARAALGFSVGLGAFEVRLLDHHQIELLEESVTRLADADPLLPLVLARLSVALAFVDSSGRRIELAERAVALGRATGESVALGYALAAWCDAVADPEHVEARLDAAAEVVVLAGRTGDLRLELLGRRLRVVALFERCDHSTVATEISGYERAAERLGDPLYSWYGDLWRATLAAADGRTVEAADCLHRAEELGALGGSTNSRLLGQVSAVMTAIDRRDQAAVDRSLTRMIDEMPEIIDPYADVTTAFAAAALGDLERARRYLALVSPAGLAALPRDSEWVCAMAQAAYAVARTELRPLAAYLVAQLEPVADLGAVEGIGAYTHGSAHRFLAMLSSIEGDRAGTRAHVDAARAAAAGGGRAMEALTDLDGAWALSRSDDERDRAAAIELAARAEVAFREVGLLGPAAEAAALAAPAPDPAPLAQPAGEHRPNQVSLIREGDAWAWTWQGRTVRVRHAKGVADLALLLQRAGREVHVRELEGVPAVVLVPQSRQVALDATAVRQYRQRLVDLEEDLDEADRRGDAGRAAALAAERDALVDELTKAFGVGGRARRVGSDPDERLRKAVSARVRASIDRLEALDPALGRHLRAAVRTGFWCSYQPEHPVTWTVSLD